MDPIQLPESSSSIIDDSCQHPIDMSTTGNHFHTTFNIMENTTKISAKSSLNKVNC
jgi:hypothetical protein